MKLLENELIKKYFGCDGSDGEPIETVMAYRILQAMSEPLNKGELVLYVDGMEAVWGPRPVADTDPSSDFHSDLWRLPDSFQPKQCEINRCNGSCMAGERCEVCKQKQAHCPCYKFQPSRECPGVVGIYCVSCGKVKEKPDAVEEKIKELSKIYFVSAEFENVLRDLVELARKQ